VFKNNSAGTLAFGFFILAALLAGAAFALSTLWKGLTALSETARVAIAATALTATATISLGIYAHHKTRQREIEHALYEKKQPVYEKLLKFLFDMMHSTRKGTAISEEEMLEFIIGFSKELILWGSDDVVRAYIDFKKAAASGEDDPKALLLSFENLLRAIRSDFGHKNKDLAPGDLLSFIITDSDEILQTNAVTTPSVTSGSHTSTKQVERQQGQRSAIS